MIYAINVIEHIADDVAALAQLRELLRPGGKLVIFVPAFPMLYSEMDRRIGHFRRYRLTALASATERAGLVVDRAELRRQPRLLRVARLQVAVQPRGQDQRVDGRHL